MKGMNSMPRMKKRADGYYKVKYHDKQFYGRTQAEAMKKRDEYISQEKNGLNHDMDNTVFLDFGLQWVETYHTDCSKPLKKQYENSVRFAADALEKRFNKKYLKDINTIDMQNLVNSLCIYSGSYVSKFMSVMNGIFRTAVYNGAILRNPMEAIKRPKCKKTEGHRALESWERDLIRDTCHEHDFGLAAMVMIYAGLRRGEVLYLDIDRDVDFEHKCIYVRGAVSFCEGNQPTVTDGKTDAAQRMVPLLDPLAEALEGHHGLVCPKEYGGLMSESAFSRKYESFIAFLERKLNGCQKGWYGRTKAHKQLLAEGKPLPEWKEVTIRCHDFRVDFCTRCYYANVPLKTLQSWMGHSDTQMVLSIYTKLSDEQKKADALKLAAYIDQNDRKTREVG